MNTAWPRMPVTLVLCLLFASVASILAFPIPVAAQATMQVSASPAPNAYGSPSYAGWASNALVALEDGLSSWGDPGLPSYYHRVTTMDDRDNIVTGFPSWLGYADPGTKYGPAFVSELGNRVTFGVHVLGNGTKIRLSNLSFNLHSSDPGNAFQFIGSFAGETYDSLSSRGILGIDYGPDHAKGGGNDTLITSGPADQLVDEIVFAGRGSAMAAYCTSCSVADQQAAIDNDAKSEYDAMMPFSLTMDYILYDDSHNTLASSSSTVYFANPPFAAPDLSLAKVHLGPDMIQGDPGSAPGTVTVGPMAGTHTLPVTTTGAPSFGPGSVQADGIAKSELYFPPSALFGHPVTIQDIASVSYWTNKPAEPNPHVDWTLDIYTVRQEDGGDSGPWFRSRLNAEPYFTSAPYTPDAWTSWATDDATYPLRFYDAPRTGVFGTYTDPHLSAFTSGPVNWSSYSTEYATAPTWDYRYEQVLYFSLQTGSAWASGFTGLLDGLTITLTSGETATVNFEAYTNTYLITVSDAAGAGPTDGTPVTVTDTLPAGMTSTAFFGLGWTTNLGTLTATRTDVLAPGQSYPPLILKVAVDPATAPSVTNYATVSGGGDVTPGNDAASDPTQVQQVPTHLGFSPQPADGQPAQTLPAIGVQVLDAGGYVVANYSGSVTLALSGGTPGAVLSGGGAAATTAGEATFSGLSVDLLGTGYHLAASAPYGAGTLTGTSAAFDIQNPAPVLTSLSPSVLAPGQPAFTLAVNGTGFLNGATVYWNGTARTTTFVSAIELTAALTASDVATAGTFPVTVLNPSPTAGPSNALDFTVSSPSEVWVDAAWAGSLPGDPVGGHTFGYDAFATVQSAVTGVADHGVIHVAAGTYTGTVNIEGRTDIQIQGAGRDLTLFQPTSTLPWNVGSYGTSRRTVLRVVGSTGIDLSGITLDQVNVRAAFVFGLLYWNSTGVLDSNRYSNASPPDHSDYSFVAHVRAVDAPYSDANRAAVTFSNSDFVDTGRVGLNVHNWVDLTVTGNTFRNNVAQTGTFGYAMEIGSTASGTVSGNTISGYDVTAGDGSESAGIYIENAFTDSLVTPVDKVVTVANNEIHDCQYGLWIGDDYSDPGVGSGPVHIMTTLTGNTIHDIAPADPTKHSAGIYLVDVNHSLGSSDSLTASANTWTAVAGPAFRFHTQGDGALHAAVTGDTITGCAGAFTADEDPTAASHDSVYDLAFHFCRIAGNSGPAQNLLDPGYYPDPILAQNNWWGCNYGPGGSGTGCAGANGVTTGITFSPWLTLSLTAAPSTVGWNATSDLAADFLTDSDGNPVSGGTIPDGTPVAFAGTLGTVAEPSVPTAGGQAATVFTAGTTAGTDGASATVDQQTLTAVTVQNPAPVLASMTPSLLAPGQPGFTLTVNGSGFLTGATVYWNGAARTTTFVSASQVTASISASDVAAAGTFPVTVLNPAPSPGPSNALDFEVANPSEVWVNGSWAGSAPGDSVGGHTFGYDAFATIQSGVDAVAASGIVDVMAGTYVENVVVGKSLTLFGADRATTVLRPATSQPLCPSSPCDTLCSGGASILLLVRADDVTVHDITLDGSNPDLDGAPGDNGVVRGGVKVHARGGIVTDYTIKAFDNLTVFNCTVQNVYLRGIYAGSTSAAHTLNIHDNTVDNVQGDDCSIGIFSRFASGSVTNNTVTRCLDAISSNWSRGLTFSGNTVSDPGTGYETSGIHTDNAGGSGGPDTITGNHVTGCDLGIWIFYPKQGATVSGNTVDQCTVGLALYAGTATPNTSTFSNNAVTGPGASVPGSSGFFLSSEYPSFGQLPASALLTANTLTQSLSGVYVQPLGSTVSLSGTGNTVTGNGTGLYLEAGTSTVAFNQNDLSGNTAGASNLSTSTADVTCNWWGNASGPTAADNPGGTGTSASGPLTYAPWWTSPSGPCDGTVATHLVFSVGPPAFATAGHAIAPSVTVQALDAADNPAVGFAGTILLSLSGGTPGALLSGGSAVAVNGTAVFPSLSVDLAGDAYMLTASFAGLPSVTSSTFDVWGVPAVVYVDKAWTGLAAGTTVTANGGPHTVGYDAFAVIQDGLSNVAPGGSVYVYPTTPDPATGYPENLVISQPVTLAKAPDAGASDVVIYPALSAPNPCSGSSLCGGAASNIILVQASDVTIHDLTLDGDNPALTSGIVRGGADLDARNGIIENSPGLFNNLEVYNCTVQNIYLRGIYPLSGGTFDVHDNTVTNVQGDSSSIGLFAWASSGTFADNTVSYANDAISANHSKGIQFLRNHVSHSGSGVHTDNAGDGGGAPDLIQGNVVTDGPAGSYGIWTFVPYLAPTVEDNTVADCEVGLSAWGQGAAVQTAFLRNTVTGSGAVGTVGAYITTDLISWGYADVSVNFENNVITGFETGVHFTADPQSWNPTPWTDQTIHATFFNNTIQGNTTGMDRGTQGTYDLTATCNFWGSDTGPHNDTLNPSGTGNPVSDGIVFVPWATTGAPGYACGGGAPAITGITDNSPCAQDGILISYSAGVGASSHDLYMDGTLAQAGYASGGLFNPGDQASHTYFIRAITGPASYADSAPASFADENGTPTPATDVQVTNPDCSGAMVTFTPSVTPGAGYSLVVDPGPTQVVVAGFTSGGRYTPPDGAVHTYVVRAINGTCTTDSAPVAFAVTNLTPPRVTDSLMLTKIGNSLLLSWALILPADVVDYYQVGRFLPQEGGPPVFDAVIGTASGQVNGIQVDLTAEPANADYLVRAVKGNCYGPWQ